MNRFVWMVTKGLVVDGSVERSTYRSYAEDRPSCTFSYRATRRISIRFFHSIISCATRSWNSRYGRKGKKGATSCLINYIA